MVAPLSIDQSMRYGYRQYNPMAGVGLGGGGGIMDMLMQMVGQNFIGSQGMMPLGVTHQNLYDRMQSYKLTQLHDQLVADAAKRDAQTMMSSVMGLRRTSGMTTTPQQYAELQSLMNQGARMAPAMIQFPGMAQTFDAMMGYRGSSVVMSEFMFRGGRFRSDPLTGEHGLGADAMKRLNADVYKAMFAGNAYTKQVMSAGQTGMLFEELQQLGLMPGGRIDADDLLRGSGKDRAALLGAVQQVTGRNVSQQNLRRELEQLSPDQMQKVMGDQGVQSAVKAFDSRRVVQGLKDYSGAVKAMQEIFGDAGKPNAPFPQLMNALNQLTGGAFTQMKPQEAEHTVRRLYNLARNSGLGVEQMMLYSQVANQQAQAMGLDPSQNVGVLESMLKSRSAIQQLGYGGGGYGQLNIQQMTQQRGFLAAAGRQSRSANQMATAMRIAETFGGFDEKGRARAFKADSEAQRYLQAVAAGQHEYDATGRGDFKSVAMSSPDLIKMLTSGADPRHGITNQYVTQRLGERGANLEFQQRFDTGAIAERAQPGEFWGNMKKTGQVHGAVMSRLNDLGVNRGQQRRLSQIVTEAGIEAMRGLDPDQMTPEARNKAIGRAIRTRLEEAAKNGDQEAARLLQQGGDFSGMASSLWGSADVTSRDARLGFGSVPLQTRIKQFHDNMAAARQAAGGRADIQAIQQNALAPLTGRGGMLGRAMQAIQDADEKTDLGELFAKTFGGVDQKDFVDALTKGGKGSALQQLRARADALKKAYDQFNTEKDPKKRQALLAGLAQSRAAYRKAVQRVTSMAGKFKQLPGQAKGATKTDSLKEITKDIGFRNTMGALGFGHLKDNITKIDSPPKTVTSEDDGEDDKNITIVIKSAKITKDGAGLTITGKGAGLPVAKGRQ